MVSRPGGCRSAREGAASARATARIGGVGEGVVGEVRMLGVRRPDALPFGWWSGRRTLGWGYAAMGSAESPSRSARRLASKPWRATRTSRDVQSTSAKAAYAAVSNASSVAVPTRRSSLAT